MRRWRRAVYTCGHIEATSCQHRCHSAGTRPLSLTGTDQYTLYHPTTPTVDPEHWMTYESTAVQTHWILQPEVGSFHPGYLIASE